MDKRLENLCRNVVFGSMVISSCILLSSCFGNMPRDTFDLSDNSTEMRNKASLSMASTHNLQLIINEPITLKTLNSENIIIRSSPIEMQNLIESQWNDRLPRLIQLKLIENFENNGKISTVGKPNQGISGDYQISSTIRSFEIDLQHHYAVITMSLKLINMHTGIIVAQKVFHVTNPFERDNKSYFIYALNRAFSRISSEIITWTLISIPKS
ncbi:MAG: ABC transporter [Candidatus Liberibacter ctenarytainae]|uniref:ABC transporter n=1 Tax=Candidatus Liberibacter ctenarytainae TaxID=2020335 RepID=A0A937AS93_9HYPH|nr:ABC transporter [Candidatus Liberibacter ctenarytainae]